MLFKKLTEILDPEPHGAALNMAIDEVLLREAREPLLRVYRWARPAVSFGYFGKFAELERAWPARDLVRRWTGGGIVPHGEDFTYTLVVPIDEPFARLTPRESYRRIHECVAAALREVGCEASVTPGAQPKVSEACFENAVAFDVLEADGKVAGAAQRRTQWGLLHQGSIQVAGLDAEFARSLAGRFAPGVLRRTLPTNVLVAASDLAAQRYATRAWLARW